MLPIKRYLRPTVTLSLLLVLALSMRGEIKWLSKSYDFGVMEEADGPKSGEVKFVNLGPEATVIMRVRPSCGCTDAWFTEGEIAPGDTAVVGFTYNPMGRPGHFGKTVRVYVGPAEEQTLVKITGTVVGTTETLQRSYPYAIGKLRLTDEKAAIGPIAFGDARHAFISLYNQTTDTLRPTAESASKALTVGINPAAIPPGDIATLGFYLNTSHDDRMGDVEYPVELTLPSGEKGNVTVTAEIVANTRTLTPEQMKMAPVAEVRPSLVDFGNRSGKTAEFSFDILNEGKSELNIHRVYSQNEAVSITRLPATVAPGKKSKVKGRLQLKALRQGPYRINVDILSDDPLHPVRTVSLVGEIKQP